MYTTRHPVPSKAALRILRQLAYISSGTACGAAALIAEERRRQTCLVKKVVENARRLKSHPRYAHGAADAAVLEEPDYTSLWDGFEGEHGHDDRHDYHVRHSGRSHQVNAGRRSLDTGAPSENTAVAKNDVLPSQVDKAYQRWTERQIRESQGPEEQGNHEAKKERHGPDPGRNTKTRQTYLRRPKEVRVQTSVSQPQKDPAYDEESVTDLLRLRLKHDLGSDGKHDQAMHRLSLFHAYRHSKKRGTRPLSSESFTAKSVESISPNSRRPQIERLVGAIHAFINLHPLPERRTPAKKSVCDFATYLLNKSVALGQVKEAESLCRWLDAHHNLSKDHLATIVDNIELLYNSGMEAKLEDNTDVTFISMVDDLFSSSMSPQNDRKNFELCIAAALLSTLSPDASSVRQHSELLVEFLRAKGSENIESLVAATCTLLAKHGRTRTATDLFLRLSELTSEMDPVLESGKALLESSARANDDHASKQMFFCLEKIGLPMGQCLDHLANVGVENHSFVKLFNICQTRSPGQLSASTYKQAFVTLSRYGRTDLATSMLSRIPGPLEPDVLRSLQTRWRIMLPRQWRETKNLKVVLDNFDSMRRLAGKDPIMVAVYNSMIRICVMAGGQDEAQRLFKQMEVSDGLKPDVDTFLSMVLGRAKKGAWSEVHQLLSLLRKDMFENVAPAKRAHYFHPLVTLYASNHDSRSLQTFVIKLFAGLDVRLHRATFSIVLKALVRDKQAQQIRDWVEHVRGHGLQIEITGGDVVDTIRSFYYERRPTSLLLGNLIRRLAYEGRHLLSRELLLLLGNALRHDIRHLPGNVTDPRSRAAFKEELVALRGHLTRIPAETPGIGRKYEAQSTTQLLSSDSSAPESKEKLAVAEPARSSGVATVNSSEFPVRYFVQYRNDDERDSSLFLRTTDQKSLYQKRSEVRSQMLFDLTLGEPSEAVGFYRQSLSSTGLSESTVSLDIAVEASLAKQNGDSIEALDIINEAQKAGMNVTSTLTPLMVNYFRQASKKEVSQLRNVQTVLGKILEFYRTMVNEGIPVSHHVAVTAARTMIQYRYPERAVALLRAAYKVTQQQSAPFDIVAYTVFLKAYIAAGDEKGAHWVVQQVLAQDVRIDGKFLREFRVGRRVVRLAGDKNRPRRIPQTFFTLLQGWQTLCRQRHWKQVRETRILGNQLVDALIDCSKPSDPQNKATPGGIVGPLVVREKHMWPKGVKKESVRMEMQWKRRTFHFQRRERERKMRDLRRARRARRQQDLSTRNDRTVLEVGDE